MNKNTELVMGIPTKDIFPHFYFSGFASIGPLTTYIMREINRHAGFRHRGTCEDDPQFKQIIPYCMVSSGDRIFAYRRKIGGGEARLHNKGSVGIGGHINPIDHLFSVETTIYKNMQRELNEEIYIDWDIDAIEYNFIGMINWDEDDVGMVHLGLVYHVPLPPGHTVKVRETDSLEGRLYSAENLPTYFANWETWSQLVIEQYLSKIKLSLS